MSADLRIWDECDLFWLYTCSTSDLKQKSFVCRRASGQRLWLLTERCRLKFPHDSDTSRMTTFLVEPMLSIQRGLESEGPAYRRAWKLVPIASPP